MQFYTPWNEESVERAVVNSLSFCKFKRTASDNVKVKTKSYDHIF